MKIKREFSFIALSGKEELSILANSMNYSKNNSWKESWTDTILVGHAGSTHPDGLRLPLYLFSF